MQKLSVKIDGRERVVEIDDEIARLDGEEVEVVEVETGAYLIRRGGEQALARVDGTGGKMTVAVRRGARDPVVVAAEVADARRARIVVPARAAGEASEAVAVRSPIPGRVVKVLVKAGERVAAGQTVVVLEAMKMENELRAPRAGTVLDVRCAEGIAVEAGQDLVSMR